MIYIESEELNALMNNFREYEKFKRMLSGGAAELDESELMNVVAAEKSMNYSDFTKLLEQKLNSKNKGE